MPIASRIIGALAGLLGAGGVAAAALAAHGGYGESLRTASEFAMIHAALAAALSLRAPSRPLVIAAAAIMAGAMLFSGDLALRALAGRGLFPMAAPTGGFLMIAGWLLTGISLSLLPKTK